MLKKFILICLFLSLPTLGFCGIIDTLHIHSPKMHKDVPAVVITPDNYKTLDVNYPVLYLLHGYSGDYLNWITQFPELKDLVNEYQMIIVCPDGGYDS